MRTKGSIQSLYGMQLFMLIYVQYHDGVSIQPLYGMQPVLDIGDDELPF